MNKQIAYVGLDVHKNSITIALLVGNSKTEEFTKKIEHNVNELVKILKKVQDKYHLRVCYEAGGCGYNIYRKLINLGIDCIVVAPSLIPEIKKKLKTDKIDAIKLATFLRAGILTAINVPDAELETDRDLVRFREFQVKGKTRIKQSIAAFLLRKGIHYEEGEYFTKKFLDWVNNLELSENDSRTIKKLLNHYNYLQKQVDELTDDIKVLSKTERYQESVRILVGFRGIKSLTAMKILTNIPDFRAFSHPKKLMSFFGITSNEESSGEKRSLGGISKRGNSLLRSSIVIAANSYVKPFRQTAESRLRRQNLPSPIIDVIQRADNRCRKRYVSITSKGKNTNVAKVAVARELVGFIWEAMIRYYDGELVLK